VTNRKFLPAQAVEVLEMPCGEVGFQQARFVNGRERQILIAEAAQGNL
jgi:hypothetical protein